MPRIRLRDLPPPYGVPFQLADNLKDLWNFIPALVEAHGNNASRFWSDLVGAFPNIISMLDATLGFFERGKAITIEVPIRIRARTFVESIKKARGNQHVVTVTAAAQTAVDAFIASAQAGWTLGQGQNNWYQRFNQWLANWLWIKLRHPPFKVILQLLRIRTEGDLFRFLAGRVRSRIFNLSVLVAEWIVAFASTALSLLALRVLIDGAEVYFDRALSQKNPRKKMKVRIRRRVGGVPP